jgi:hypothetical protein
MLKKLYILLFAPFLLLTGCKDSPSPSNFTNAKYYYNDSEKDVILTTKNKQNIDKVISKLTFNPIREINNYNRSYYHFSLSFDIVLKEGGNIRYNVDFTAKLIVRFNPLLSSTLSDYYAYIDEDALNILYATFKVPSENEKAGINVATFEVKYDYGFHVEKWATPLLNDSLLFFTPHRYQINDIRGGDVFKVYYKGILEIKETYPSVVETSKITIIDVIRIPSRIIKGQLLNVPGSENEYEFIGPDISSNKYPEYVISDDYSFAPISEYYEKMIYASMRRDDLNTKPIIKAFYDAI